MQSEMIGGKYSDLIIVIGQFYIDWAVIEI